MTDREAFESWYDSQPDGKMQPFDVWQAALRKALEQPEQEPVDPEPFGYFQYDIRLDAWVQNRINNKGAAFYTAGDIRALKHRIHDQDLMLERQTARIVGLQDEIRNLTGEE